MPDIIKEFSSLSTIVQELIISATEGRKASYSPYSKFAVGAALRMANFQIFNGCNIENAAFSPTICAERTACCKAVSNGQKIIRALAVVAEQQSAAFTTPCGVCRQFLYEFVEEDFPIYVSKPEPKEVLCTSLMELLPLGFRCQ